MRTASGTTDFRGKGRTQKRMLRSAAMDGRPCDSCNPGRLQKHRCATTDGRRLISAIRDDRKRICYASAQSLPKSIAMPVNAAPRRVLSLFPLALLLIVASLPVLADTHPGQSALVQEVARDTGKDPATLNALLDQAKLQ